MKINFLKISQRNLIKSMNSFEYQLRDGDFKKEEESYDRVKESDINEAKV